MRIKIELLCLLLIITHICISNNDDNKSKEMNERAIEFISKFQFDSALIYIDKAIMLDSNFINAYTNKVSICIELKKYDEALIAIKKAITRRPSSGLHSLEGIVYENKGQLDSAKECYKKAIHFFQFEDSSKRTYNHKSVMAMFVTITEGKEKGLQAIQQVIDEVKDRISRLALDDLLFKKNEIENYQGGGNLEFVLRQGKNYCIVVSENEKDKLVNFLLDNGVNVYSQTGKENKWILEIGEKFQKKAVTLGIQLIECSK